MIFQLVTFFSIFLYAFSVVTVDWDPVIVSQLGQQLPPAGDGGGIDDYFRNSGCLVKDGFYYAVNGVHPVNSGDYTSYYPKSLVKVSIETDEIEQTFSFSEAFSHDIDMEALSFGPDNGENYTFIGDEYNYVYQMDLSTGALVRQWNLADIGISTSTDKGIESLTFSQDTGYFYAGIQETKNVHEIQLDVNEDCSDECSVTEISSFQAEKSPSGMFYSHDDELLYILCGTQTNGDQYLYTYSVEGELQCEITIPASSGLSRTDGFYIEGDLAYIADSQGPMWVDEGSLGYNLYAVEWDNPCVDGAENLSSAFRPSFSYFIIYCSICILFL